MESDSSLSSIALALSLAAFLFTCLVETTLTPPRLEGLRGRLEPQGLLAHTLEYLRRRVSVYSETAKVLRMAATVASTVSVVALAVSLTGANWGAISVGALGLWVLLTALRRGTFALAVRWNWLLMARLLPVILVGLWPFSPLGQAATRVRRLPHSASGQGVVSEDAGDVAEGSAVLPIEAPQEQLDPRERSMIRAVLRLEKTTAREIMVPRVDILAADVETPVARVTEMMMTEGGHSRIPIYEETVDNIVGIVYARDLLGSLTRQQKTVSLRDVARPAYFIPDSKRVDELLEELQEKRVHIALVVDEYGGVAGLVTIEDLLEEIVGEIADEFDVEEPAVQHVTEQEAVVDARASLELVNETFSTRISGEGFDTLGGFVYSQLGKIPSPGDEVLSNGVKIEVLSTLGRRIKKVRITRVRPEQENHEEQR